MVAIRNFFLLATAAVAYGIGLEERASPVQTVITDMKTISTNVDRLTTGLNNYAGGFFEATRLVPMITAIDSSLLQAASDSTKLSDVSLADAGSILNAVAGVKDPVTKALAALASNAESLHDAKLDYVVVLFLQNLSNDIDTLGNTLTSKAPNQATKTAAHGLLDFFDKAFKTAAQGFNNPLESIFTGVGQLFGPPKANQK